MITEIDQGDFEDVLLNLSLNAHDAMPDGGTLTITTSNQALHNVNSDNTVDFVKLSISDNGIGMSEEVRDKALEPFFTTKDTGTGIGLSLSKQIMHLHGGSMSVHSVPHKETSFLLVF